MGVLGTVFLLEATAPSGLAVIEDSPVTSGADVTGPTHIRIRGNVPLGQEPLVYVDGVRVDNSSGMLKRLNPDRIDRVEVIKGPAARIKYGSEAEHGAIQIFLKPRDGSDGEVNYGGR